MKTTLDIPGFVCLSDRALQLHSIRCGACGASGNYTTRQLPLARVVAMAHECVWPPADVVTV
jgi:hypothetical protein